MCLWVVGMSVSVHPTFIMLPHYVTLLCYFIMFRTVVVMRRGRTASCRAGQTVNRVLLGQSTWDATYVLHETLVAYSWGPQSKLWVEIGAIYNGSCKPQSCQKQKDNYSTDYVILLCYFIMLLYYVTFIMLLYYVTLLCYAQLTLDFLFVCVYNNTTIHAQYYCLNWVFDKINIEI